VTTLTAGAPAWEFKLATEGEAYTFSYDGDGAADLGKVKSNYGLMLIVR